jgi:anaerobic ribonucleoside-triphosphate reductase
MIELSDSERQPCEVWSRCMGYHRPINYWNVGKQSEHRERKMFRTAETEAKLRETA